MRLFHLCEVAHRYAVDEVHAIGYGDEVFSYDLLGHCLVSWSDGSNNLEPIDEVRRLGVCQAVTRVLLRVAKSACGESRCCEDERSHCESTK